MWISTYRNRIAFGYKGLFILLNVFPSGSGELYIYERISVTITKVFLRVKKCTKNLVLWIKKCFGVARFASTLNHKTFEIFFIISRLLMYRNVLALRFAILSLLSCYIMQSFKYEMYPTHTPPRRVKGSLSTLRTSNRNIYNYDAYNQ